MVHEMVHETAHENPLVLIRGFETYYLYMFDTAFAICAS